MLQTIQRRSGRISKEIPIQLFGSDARGKVFTEHTKTVLLSRHGAGIVSRYKLNPEEELIVRRLDTNTETEIRIVGQVGCESESYTYGAEIQDANINFWGIEFPPLTEGEKAARYRLLQCGACKNREKVNDIDIVSDVNAINDGIVRFCKCCEFSTVWRWAAEDADVTEPEPSPSPTSVAQTTLPAAQPPNRRKRIRAKVSFSARVRRVGLDEDIVVCEDMSRGGLRFVSSKRYDEKSLIEVAAPHAPGIPDIFVRAAIVYALELPDKRLFRCGAEYLKYS